MIARKDFNEFMNQYDIDLNEKTIKQLNLENMFLKYIGEEKPKFKAIPQAKPTKGKTPNWLISNKQQRAVYGNK
jgi:hypothetical protein